MKKITIEGREYEMESSAFSYIKYQTFFHSGMTKDLQFMEMYLAKQHVYAEKLKESGKSEEEQLEELSNLMIDETDKFIAIVTQMAWIMIYTANPKVADYDTFMKSLTKFNIADPWISEVTELAVQCFHGQGTD